jgi:hypothetical protein
MYYPEATTFILTGKNIEYLFVVLNSKISEWFFSSIGTTTGVGTIRWKKFTIEQLLVIPPNSEILSKINYLINILRNKQIHYKDFEQETNIIINTLYGFDRKEVDFIEKQVNKGFFT